MAVKLGKWMKSLTSNKLVFGFAALAFLLIQTITFSHDAQADHDISGENTNCAICAYIVVKDDVAAPPQFEYSVNTLAEKSASPAITKTADISLELSASPRAPPADLFK
jgi:hypothetical protein